MSGGFHRWAHAHAFPSQTGSSHCGVWGWWSKRPGGRGQCRGTTTEHRSSPWAPHQPKLACNSGTRTLCSTRKRCNSNGAISTFEIRVGELRAAFLRNHNMRRHKGTTKCPKQKTTQAQKTPTTPTAATTATSTGALHPLCGGAPVMWRCTRYVALHPLRGAAPEQKRCIAYGSGAVPQHTRTNAELAHRTTHRRTPPCAAGPYWWQDGHAAHATTCTPAHPDTSHTLKCEEPPNRGLGNLPSEILCLDNQTGLSRMVAPAFLADVYNRDSQESCNDSRLRSRNRDQ